MKAVGWSGVVAGGRHAGREAGAACFLAAEIWVCADISVRCGRAAAVEQAGLQCQGRSWAVGDSGARHLASEELPCPAVGTPSCACMRLGLTGAVGWVLRVTARAAGGWSSAHEVG